MNQPAYGMIGDTVVECVDGEHRTFEFLEFAYSTMRYEYEGWGWDAQMGCIRAAALTLPCLSSSSHQLVSVTLSNNMVFTSAPEHCYQLAGGQLCVARLLAVGTLLKADTELEVTHIRKMRYEHPVPLYSTSIVGTASFKLYEGPFVQCKSFFGYSLENA